MFFIVFKILFFSRWEMEIESKSQAKLHFTRMFNVHSMKCPSLCLQVRTHMRQWYLSPQIRHTQTDGQNKKQWFSERTGAQWNTYICDHADTLAKGCARPDGHSAQFWASSYQSKIAIYDKRVICQCDHWNTASFSAFLGFHHELQFKIKKHDWVLW